MADLPRLHAQATRLILSLREGLERLEAAEVCIALEPDHLVNHSNCPDCGRIPG